MSRETYERWLDEKGRGERLAQAHVEDDAERIPNDANIHSSAYYETEEDAEAFLRISAEAGRPLRTRARSKVELAQHEADRDNLFERDGISHRTGGRWRRTEVSKREGWDESKVSRDMRGRFAKAPSASNPFIFDPPPIVRAAMEKWWEHKGVEPPPKQSWRDHTIDTETLLQVGEVYDSLPEYDAEAEASFAAMRDDTDEQFLFLTEELGLTFEVMDEDPYRNVREMVSDVVNNGRLRVLSTASTGGHPFFSDQTNDRFRFVHDFFGHVATGRGFDRHGEDAAYQHHVQMFSEAARPAMASETRGQNASLIKNQDFGPQRVALMPEWTWASNAVVSKHYGPGPHKNGTPQTIHGKKGGAGLTRDALSKPPGQRGATYDRRKNEYRSQGFAISVFPDDEAVVQPGENPVPVVDEFIDKTWDRVRESDNIFIGLWLDDLNGDRAASESPLYVDLSIVVDTAEEAEALSHEYKQEGFYDLASGTTIYVGAREERVAKHGRPPERGHILVFRP